MNNELYHHGIKGQRWGQRNGPPYPLDSKDHSASERKAGWRSSLQAPSSGNSKYRQHKQARKIRKLERKWVRQDRKDDATKRRLDKTGKSKWRQQYEAEYIKKGMTQREAEVAAYKKERAIKIAQAAGIITLATATACIGYRHYDKNVDRFLKTGVELKRVSKSPDLAVHDGFYAVLGKNKLDTTKYAGLYANELGGLGLLGTQNDVYQKTINVGKSGLKIASEKSGLQALRQYMGHDSGKQAVRIALTEARDSFESMGRAQNQKACEEALKALKAGRINGKVYRGLVSAMGPLDGPSITKVKRNLYAQLKANGYGGIQDLNDKFVSGYRAKMPVIVFDARKVNVTASRKLTEDEIRRNLIRSAGSIYLANASPSLIQIGGAFVGGKAIKRARQVSREDRIVAEYRKSHPNTELSYNEIVRGYYRTRG